MALMRCRCSTCPLKRFIIDEHWRGVKRSAVSSRVFVNCSRLRLAGTLEEPAAMRSGKRRVETAVNAGRALAAHQPVVRALLATRRASVVTLSVVCVTCLL